MTYVAAVVPAYAPDAELVDLVADLVPQVDRVVVVDDGSPGLASADRWDACRAAGASVVAHETNRGIAAALNTGVREALSHGSVHAVLTVDQDSRVPPGFVAALVERWTAAADTGLRVGLVAPEQVTGLPAQRDGRPPIQSGQLVPVNTLTRVGDFDESLFIDGVDDDFALRCLDAGLAILVVPGLALGHRLGAGQRLRVAGRGVTLTRSAPFRSYYLARNRAVLVRRYARRHPGWAGSQVLGLGRHLAVMLL
ncbi:MAG: glycosyltransferase, partial [Lapillicoccus sp.]